MDDVSNPAMKKAKHWAATSPSENLWISVNKHEQVQQSTSL